MSAEMTTKLANPGPLGLLGFGMTTILLNIHNAGLLPQSIMIVAMGIAMGGLAQIIAGIRELCQGNTFAGTAFTAYGLFWWSLVLIWVNPFAEAGIEGASKIAMGYFLFVLLALGDFTGNHSITTIAGFEGIFCGASAIYSAVGQILNAEYGKEMFPLG